MFAEIPIITGDTRTVECVDDDPEDSNGGLFSQECGSKGRRQYGGLHHVGVWVLPVRILAVLEDRALDEHIRNTAK